MSADAHLHDQALTLLLQMDGVKVTVMAVLSTVLATEMTPSVAPNDGGGDGSRHRAGKRP